MTPSASRKNGDLSGIAAISADNQKEGGYPWEETGAGPT